MSALLLRPLAYLTIQHPSARLPVVNWWLPAGLAMALVVLGAWMAPTINLYHAGGLLDRLLGFVQNLPGFYLAALAAVATFGSDHLDRVMPGTPARGTVVYEGALRTVDLTRRRFLTMMFAYLTALSFGLTLVAILALTVVEPIAHTLSTQTLLALRVVFALAYLTFLMQMLVVTLWGLFYLGERMHTPNA